MGSAAAAPEYFTAKLKGRREVAERTLACEFERPTGFEFKAGQSIDMTLLNPPETDAEGDKRAFSVASAPHENTLMFATRLRDTAFKRVLQSLPLGSEVKIEGPFGNMTLHNKASRPAVILAGGIGITPFRSMLLRATHDKLPHHILLFFSNRRPEDAPFLAELQSLEGQNPNYRLIATMTEAEKSHQSWKGERGYINQELLSRHLKEIASPVYYLAGPPGMVKAMHAMLNAAGVDDDDIRSEEFAGY